MEKRINKANDYIDIFEKIIFENISNEKINVICLNGDVGMGKTTFVRLFMQFIGYQKDVTSPTYTIINEYSFLKYKIMHADCYRINNEDLDWSFYFDNFNFNFIEWSENISNFLPNKKIIIDFKKDKDNTRIIKLRVNEG